MATSPAPRLFTSGISANLSLYVPALTIPKSRVPFASLVTTIGLPFALFRTFPEPSSRVAGMPGTGIRVDGKAVYAEPSPTTPRSLKPH